MIFEPYFPCHDVLLVAVVCRSLASRIGDRNSDSKRFERVLEACLTSPGYGEAQRDPTRWAHDLHFPLSDGVFDEVDFSLDLSAVLALCGAVDAVNQGARVLVMRRGHGALLT